MNRNTSDGIININVHQVRNKLINISQAIGSTYRHVIKARN